ncbi:MAG: hypothetical protein QG661_1776 [Actinomycetota bacterium]|nr:hypothetical protein [Actinomycetota bacterium]
MRLSGPATRTATAVGVAVVAIGVIVALAMWGSGTSPTTSDNASVSPAAPADAADVAPAVVRDSSHILGDPADGSVTLVEFLDFECESCKAMYPFVEALREEYSGRVRFVARYFPIPSHANAVNAALAVEAASQQGSFEDMYSRMYESQEQWGEQQDSKAGLFREWAQEFGLDLAAFDAAVADPANLERIELDRQDGLALGVEGTPTFFLNGVKIQPETGQEFVELIDAELAATR